jgi:hypothetical protein
MPNCVGADAEKRMSRRFFNSKFLKMKKLQFAFFIYKNVKLCLYLLLIIMLSSVFSCNCNQEELDRFTNGVKNGLIKKTEISATDNTPPTMVWEITDLSGGLPPTTLSASENSLNIFYGANLKVVLKAEDPESGIRNMSWELSSK